MVRRVALIRTEVLEERSASIIKGTRIIELAVKTSYLNSRVCGSQTLMFHLLFDSLLGSLTVMFYLLFDSSLPEFDHWLEMCAFSALQ
jgi:hypothetical protein